jgi:hypothetical protein
VAKGTIELPFDNHVFAFTFHHFCLHTIPAGCLIAALQVDRLSGFKIVEMFTQGALEIGSLLSGWFHHIKYSK